MASASVIKWPSISLSVGRVFLDGNLIRFMTFIEFKRHLVALECTAEEFLKRWKDGDVTVGFGTAFLWIAWAPQCLA